MDIADDDELDQSMGAANGDVTTNGYVEEDTAINSIEDASMQVPPNGEDTEMGDAGAGAIDESMPLQEEPPEEPSPPKRGRGRPKTSRASDASVVSLSKATRGRPPTVHRDTEDEQPAESSSTAAQKGKRGKKDKALRDVSAARGPNAKINSRSVSKARAKVPSRSASRVSISRVIQRSETPGNGESGLVTQRGRVSIKPLAHWRGEKAIFDPGSVDKSDRQLGRSLGGMTEIIRTEIIDDRPAKKKSGYRRPAARAKSRRLEDVEEEDEDKEPWEVETGVLNATVMQWDSTTNHYIEDQTEEKGMVSLSSFCNSSFGRFLMLRYRNCLRQQCDRNARHLRSRISLCQNPHPPVLRVRDGRLTSWWRQKEQKQQENANGVFRVLWSGAG